MTQPSAAAIRAAKAIIRRHQAMHVDPEQVAREITFAAETVDAEFRPLVQALWDIFEHAYDDDTEPGDIIIDFDAMREIARAALAKCEAAQ